MARLVHVASGVRLVALHARYYLTVLIRHGANATDHDKNGLNALHYAARSGDKETIRFLFNTATDGDFTTATDKRGRNALHHLLTGSEVAYSATKASIDHMSRAGALDHAKDHININCVAPGVIATGMARGNLENGSIHQAMTKATPWPRLGTVDDIAAAVVFFCLPESQWITARSSP
jgi:NAD(P)-dependent dehydrogenase (short-subunit alcohol dehydrogenase family)